MSFTIRPLTALGFFSQLTHTHHLRRQDCGTCQYSEDGGRTLKELEEDKAKCRCDLSPSTKPAVNDHLQGQGCMSVGTK